MKQNFIYLRFSREDENTELNIRYERDLKTILETFNLNKEDCNIFIEKEAISAYNTDKFEKREAFIELNNILFEDINSWKQIFITKKENSNKILYIKSFDRISRNITHLTQFLLLCIERKIKVLSVNEPHINRLIEDFILREDISTNEKFLTIFQFCLLGYGAEDYSKQISIKTKKAFQKDNKGQTISYKGNKVGRKEEVPKKVKDKIIEYNKKGLSLRDISKQKDIYRLIKKEDKYFKKSISAPTIAKILQD